jgi:hypothetical protein
VCIHHIENEQQVRQKNDLRHEYREAFISIKQNLQPVMRYDDGLPFHLWIKKKIVHDKQIPAKRRTPKAPSRYQWLFEQKLHPKLGLFAFVHSSVKTRFMKFRNPKHVGRREEKQNIHLRTYKNRPTFNHSETP